MSPDGGTLVLLYGGPSAEHEVSCVSALHVARAAEQTGRTVLTVGVTRERRWAPARAVPEADASAHSLPSPDEVLEASGGAGHALEVLGDLPPGTVVFPLLHGPFGEDGVVQGLLEGLNLPYVGSGVLASALCMDKGVAKSLLGAHGIAQPRWTVCRGVDAVPSALIEELGLPMFVKPANLGSSIGISMVTDPAQLGDALALAMSFDDVVVCEEGIAGREIEVAVIGNDEPRVLGAGEVEPSRPFYDYEDKYVLGAATLSVPAPLSQSELADVSEMARQAYLAMHVEGLARIDFFLHAGRGFLLNEVNTMPGFTPISMFPRLWMATGCSFSELVDELVVFALARHQRRSSRQLLP